MGTTLKATHGGGSLLLLLILSRSLLLSFAEDLLHCRCTNLI